MATMTAWLIVGNGSNWGKGKTLADAFASCMIYDSKTYPTTALHIRRIVAEVPAEPEATTAEDLYALVRVDEMGAAYWPAGATVKKIDVDNESMPGTADAHKIYGRGGDTLHGSLIKAIKAYRTFIEEWGEFVTSDAMESAFDFAANEDGE